MASPFWCPGTVRSIDFTQVGSLWRRHQDPAQPQEHKNSIFSFSAGSVIHQGGIWGFVFPICKGRAASRWPLRSVCRCWFPLRLSHGSSPGEGREGSHAAHTKLLATSGSSFWTTRHYFLYENETESVMECNLKFSSIFLRKKQDYKNAHFGKNCNDNWTPLWIWLMSLNRVVK